MTEYDDWLALEKMRESQRTRADRQLLAVALVSFAVAVSVQIVVWLVLRFA